MGKTWEQAVCYSSPNFIEHEVNGVKQKFYPISVGLLFKLRTAAKNVIKAVAELFVDVNRDRKTVDSQTGAERVIVIESIRTETAQYRDKQKADAWANAFDAISDEATVALLMEIIMDSMAEVFIDGQKPSPKELLQKTKTPTLIQMVIGTAKGNADVLGPLAPKVRSTLQRLGEAVSTRLTDLTDKEDTSKDKSSTAG